MPDSQDDRNAVVAKLERTLALQEAFEVNGNVGDLKRVVSFWKDLVWSPAFETLDIRVEADALNQAACASNSQFEIFGDLSALGQAIVFWRKAVALTAKGEGDFAREHPGYLWNLGLGLLSQFKCGDTDTDVEALQCLENSAALLRHDSETYGVQSGILAKIYGERHQRTGDGADLERHRQWEIMANKQSEEAKTSLPLTSERCRRLEFEYSRTADLTLLRDVIQCYEGLLSKAGDAPEGRGVNADRLGNYLQEWFARTGAVDALDKSIHAFTVALNSGKIPRRLSNLGAALLTRFQQRRGVADLHTGMRCLEEAVSGVPLGSEDWCFYANNLAQALHYRYSVAREREALERSIVLSEEVLKHCPERSASRPGYLNMLAVALIHRFEDEGDLTDSDRAIAAWSNAMERIEPRTEEWSGFLSNIAEASLRASKQLKTSLI